nr:hypothetical protein [Tanacetum cinerariifolium]
MTTLAEFMILVDADNHPPMLDKAMYVTWESRSRRNNASRQGKVIKCYNFQAQENGQVLDEEQLAFLADPGTPDGQAAQTTIPHNAAFQIKDLDAYDSACDDVSLAKAVLMMNLSSCDLDVLFEIPYIETYQNELNYESVQGYVCLLGESYGTLHIRVKRYEELTAIEKLQADCDLRETNIVLQGLLLDAYSLLNHHRGNVIGSRRNNASGQRKVIKCYNFQDPGTLDGQAAQTTILHNAAFQIKDLDAYDSDCDDVSLAKSVLMTNLSSCDLDVLFEVPYIETYQNELNYESV